MRGLRTLLACGAAVVVVLGTGVGADVEPPIEPAPCQGGLVVAHGELRFLDVEGGCWQFLADDGTPYQPIGGPAEAYCEGPGTLTGCLRPDLASTCQVGAIVEILAIEPDPFTVDGTMHFVNVEGGCWQFLADDGMSSYQPIDGPAALFVDGASGRITGTTPCLLGTFCQTGTLIVVTEFVPDADPCAADVTGDGAVGVADLLGVLAAWGPCAGCPEDADASGVVDVGDLLAVLGGWGGC